MFTTPIGHTTTQAQLAQLLSSSRMPHAIMLSGPQGIGKATLGATFAARLVCGGQGGTIEPNTSSPQYAQLLAGSCPDFHLLTPADGKKSIGVEPVRDLLTTLKRTADTNRVVLIDSIDDMTPEAANTLLKTLEEPRPGIYFILVCHRLGQILPTIRSRCRLMLLSPLSADETKKVLLAAGTDVEELPALISRAQGCPGQVLKDIPAPEQILLTLAQNRTYQGATAYQKALQHIRQAKMLNLPAADSLTYLKNLVPDNS